MKQKDLTKLNKSKNVFVTLIIIFSIILGIAAFIIEVTFETDDGWTEAVLITGVLVSCVAGLGLFLSFILFSRVDKKLNQAFNQSLEAGFEVIRNKACFDILDSALFYVKKRRDFTCKIGLMGKAENIDFEYYHIKVEKASFLINKNLGYMDVFVFNNINVFQQTLVVSTGEDTTVSEEYKKYTINDYFIYAKNEDNWDGLRLPKDAFFFSIVDHTAYLFINAEENEFSNPYHFKNTEEFKLAFNSKLNQIMNLYEELKAWLK